MSATHLGHDSARSERLFNNAGLVVDRPPPTRAKAADKLNPPHRPAGLKRMVKSRHKTILHGPPDSTFTPRQRRWVRDHAYPKLVDRWCTGDLEALREIDDILREHGTDREAIMAQAVLRHLPVFDALERMSANARSQRDRTG